jgi:hypothetical protein
MRRALFIAAVASFAAPSLARAATLTVGTGKMYAAPCAAVAAANDGDTIEIDAAGAYGGDVCAIAKNGLTLRGVAGRPKIDAAGKNSGGKGIWVISGNDTTVENIEFSGATVPDQNGAGIRQEGANLTVSRCYFHDNENGILSGAGAASAIVVEYSEFANNGFGDGYSHNMYIGNVGRFTLRYSYSHHAKVGHLVKSRAAENYILYNRLSGEDGTASYELDLPNAGTSYVIGNILQQGASTQNPTLLTYGVEGATAGNPGHALFVVNNTFVNDRTAGGTFIAVGSAITTAAILRNNIFAGTGTITTQSIAVQTTNFSQGDPMFIARGALDYRLSPGSTCIDMGSDPGTGAGFALTPTQQYIHPAGAVDRVIAGALDIGAYELGAGIDAGPAIDAGTDAATRPDASSGTDAAFDVARDGSFADGTIRDTSASDATSRDVANEPPTVDAPSRDAWIDGGSDVHSEDVLPPTSVPDASGDAPLPPGTSGDDAGCGCRLAAHGGAANGALAFVAAFLVAQRRRRTRDRRAR